MIVYRWRNQLPTCSSFEQWENKDGQALVKEEADKWILTSCFKNYKYVDIQCFED